MCPFLIDLSKRSASRNHEEKRKDTPTINVIGQLVDLMLAKIILPKYLDRGIPLVNVHINKSLIQNTLIDLGAAINVMTRDTMLRLNLQGFLRDTPIVLQLADRSTIKPKEMLEDIMLSIDSWEYPSELLVLQSKSKFNGYPLILGRPFHWSGNKITLNHAKLVQQLSNVLLLRDEYVLWILYHFNAQIVVKMSQICHLEDFLRPFLCGCNVAFIVPCYEQNIYI
jgi:hypothetical protein